MQTDKRQAAEHGNAIWIILLTISLFGMLAAVISRNSTSVDQAGDVEQTRIAVSSAMRYAKSIENAIQTLQLNNGCSENEISFENSAVSGYTNANAPTDKRCHIFDAQGAGITWQTRNKKGKEWFVSSTPRVPSTDDAPGNDVVLFLRDVSREFCAQANKSLHDWSSIPRWDAGAGFLWHKATGTYGSSGVVLSLPRPGTAWKDDVMTACFENVGVGEYDFYHVLILR